MKTALITGACGFVGNAIAHALQLQGWNLHLFDLPGNPHWSSSPQGVTVHRFEGDIRNPLHVKDAIRGCSHVFHTAALLNSIAPRKTFLDINLQGTQNICEASLESGVERVFYFSTSDVFGIPAPQEIISEATPLRPWNEPYADSKVAATEYVRQCIQHKRLPATIIYPGWVYGPGDRQFFPAIMNMVRDKWVFTWHRRRPYEVDLIHIDDLIHAVMLMLETPASKGQDFLILDNGTQLTPALFYRLIAEELGINITILKLPYSLMWLVAWCSQTLKQRGMISKHLLSTTDVKAFGNDFNFSTDKARRLLGWEPQTHAHEGVRQAVRWQMTSTQ